MSEQTVEVPKQEEYPPYVLSEEERARWDLSCAIAEQWVALYAPDDPGHTRLVWQMARSVYRSDVTTGSADQAPPLAEAEQAPPNPDAEQLRARATELWQQLKRSKPGDGASEEDYWAHVARICNLFDEILGDPDDIHAAASGGELGEAFEHVVAAPYRPGLHPRDRLGKWARALHAAHPQGVGRARRAHAAAIVGLAGLYSSEAAERLGPTHANVTDPGEAASNLTYAPNVADAGHRAAAYVLSHHDLVQTAAQLARHAARAKGLAAAEREPVGDAELSG